MYLSVRIFFLHSLQWAAQSIGQMTINRKKVNVGDACLQKSNPVQEIICICQEEVEQVMKLPISN